MEQEGIFFGAAGVRQELDRRMQSRKFRADMDGFLANRLTYSPTSAYNTFCDIFLPCLGE